MAGGDVDRSAIEAAVEAAGGSGISSVRQVPSLSGNTMFDVRTHDRERLAVRFSTNAAAVAREPLIGERLRGVVSIPETLLAEPNGTVTGYPTLVVRWVEGQSLDTAVTFAGEADATELGCAVGEALSRLAGVELAAPGWLPGKTLDVEPREHHLAEGVRRHLHQRLFDTESGHELDTEVGQRFWQLVDSRVDSLAVLEGDRSLVHGRSPRWPAGLAKAWRWSPTSTIPSSW